MKTTSLALLLTTIVAAAAPASATEAQSIKNYPYARERVFTLTISEIKQHYIKAAPLTLVTLIVKADGKECRVYVGTPEFLKERKFSFAPGDVVSVKGVLVEPPEQKLTPDTPQIGNVIHAREITVGGRTLPLLNPNGRGAWIKKHWYEF